MELAMMEHILSENLAHGMQEDTLSILKSRLSITSNSKFNYLIHCDMHLRKLLLLTLLLLTTSLLASCKGDNDNITESISFIYKPSVCDVIRMSACSINYKIYSGKASPSPMDSASISSTQLGLWMMTGDSALLEMTKEEPNESLSYYERTYSSYSMQGKRVFATQFSKLERILFEDYSKQRDSRSNHDEVAARVIPWEYRVTGVKDFRIEATTPLFGQPAGTSLNKYFSIFEFRLKQIISYHTKSLVWGYQSHNKVERIDQWLALKPMAPPAIVFRLNSVPPEVPTRVSFVSILTTTDGKELRDTTMVRLTK